MRTFVSLAALGVILFGVRYAYGREKLRKTDLHAWYEEDNRRHFDGQLPDVHVWWGNLQSEGDLGITRTGEGGYLEIILDRYELTTEDDARSVLHHEECHCAALAVEEPLHGPEFQKCMAAHGFVETR